MKRREFCKSLGLLGTLGMMPAGLLGPSVFSPAHAASLLTLRNSYDEIKANFGWRRPTTMPKVIMVFLYGGASELASNLSNIVDINNNSQNKYRSELLPQSNGNDGTAVTKNKFWGGGGNGAGGEIMENMISKNRMSIYRTLNRTVDDSKAHRPSVFSNLTGLMGEDDARPGIATSLAAILYAHGAINEDSLFPFVSLEGESMLFNTGDLIMPPVTRPISLDDQLNNPYSRANNSAVSGAGGVKDVDFESIERNKTLDLLANSIANTSGQRFDKIRQAFDKRATISARINEIRRNQTDPNNIMPEDPDNPGTLLAYPTSNFGRRMKQAVNIVSSYPETMFVSVGSGGLGGWDDHDSALDVYPRRMREMMQALDVASKHLEQLGKTNPAMRNVAMFVFSDFGRNVNLNNSLGWDHGNNQSLYTVSGGDIAGRQLGKLIGTTERIGKSGENRQFTSPTSGSYQAQPFAVAATIYKYFGIENPQDLTGGVAPLDEFANDEFNRT